MSIETNESLEHLAASLESLLDAAEKMQLAEITDDVRSGIRSLFENMSRRAIEQLGVDDGLDYRTDLETRVLNIAPLKKPKVEIPRPFHKYTPRPTGADGGVARKPMGYR